MVVGCYLFPEMVWILYKPLEQTHMGNQTTMFFHGSSASVTDRWETGLQWQEHPRCYKASQYWEGTTAVPQHLKEVITKVDKTRRQASDEFDSEPTSRIYLSIH